MNLLFLTSCDSHSIKPSIAYCDKNMYEMAFSCNDNKNNGRNKNWNSVSLLYWWTHTKKNTCKKRSEKWISVIVLIISKRFRHIIYQSICLRFKCTQNMLPIASHFNDAMIQATIFCNREFHQSLGINFINIIRIIDFHYLNHYQLLLFAPL